jgi:hypothetical protein
MIRINLDMHIDGIDYKVVSELTDSDKHIYSTYLKSIVDKKSKMKSAGKSVFIGRIMEGKKYGQATLWQAADNESSGKTHAGLIDAIEALMIDIHIRLIKPEI